MFFYVVVVQLKIKTYMQICMPCISSIYALHKNFVYKLIKNISTTSQSTDSFRTLASNSSSIYLNFGAAHTLSLVLVGALLSSPKQTLHFVQSNAFDALLNFPGQHVVHSRSVVWLPGVAYLPAEQFAHAWHTAWFDKTENLPG